jgi:hypothetical protein
MRHNSSYLHGRRIQIPTQFFVVVVNLAQTVKIKKLSDCGIKIAVPLSFLLLGGLSEFLLSIGMSTWDLEPSFWSSFLYP